MYTDAQLRFSNAQPIGTGTVQSTHIVDLGVAGRNIGRGEPMRLAVTTDVTFTGGTSIVINYCQSANPDGSSPDILSSSPAVLTASLSAGQTIRDVHLTSNTKRYVFLQYVVTGTYGPPAIIRK